MNKLWATTSSHRFISVLLRLAFSYLLILHPQSEAVFTCFPCPDQLTFRYINIFLYKLQGQILDSWNSISLFINKE